MWLLCRRPAMISRHREEILRPARTHRNVTKVCAFNRHTSTSDKRLLQVICVCVLMKDCGWTEAGLLLRTCKALVCISH